MRLHPVVESCENSGLDQIQCYVPSQELERADLDKSKEDFLLRSLVRGDDDDGGNDEGPDEHVVGAAGFAEGGPMWIRQPISPDNCTVTIVGGGRGGRGGGRHRPRTHSPATAAAVTFHVGPVYGGGQGQGGGGGSSRPPSLPGSAPGSRSHSAIRGEKARSPPATASPRYVQLMCLGTCRKEILMQRNPLNGNALSIISSEFVSFQLVRETTREDNFPVRNQWRRSSEVRAHIAAADDVFIAGGAEVAHHDDDDEQDEIWLSLAHQCKLVSTSVRHVSSDRSPKQICAQCMHDLRFRRGIDYL